MNIEPVDASMPDAGKAALTLQQGDLERFFCIEAPRSEPGIPWRHSRRTYSGAYEHLQVQLHILPATGEVALTIEVEGFPIYRLDAQRAADVRIHQDTDQEILEITLGEDDRVFVRLRPSILVTHQARGAVR